MGHDLVAALEALDVCGAGDDARAALADRIVERIEGTPAGERAALVDALGLPASARPLARFAVAVLRVLVEDPALVRHADAAMQLWLVLDEHGAIPVARAAREHLSTSTLREVARRVDPEERAELLAFCARRERASAHAPPPGSA